MTASLLAPLALVAALLAGPQPSLGQTYTVGAGSQFWIDGTSTLGAFACEADEVGGYGRLRERRSAALDAEVVIPVRSLDCGVPQMNSDLYEALQGQRHPAIRFVLGAAKAADPGAEGWTPFRVSGTLRLAGTARRVTLDAEGRTLVDGRVRIRGRHPLRMTDFGIEPPTGLLGLVRAHDAIAVRFDLLAAPAAPAPAAPAPAAPAPSR